MRILSFLSLILFCLTNGFSQDIKINKPFYPDAAILDLKIDVVYLASDYLEGRQTGKPGEALAAEYIIHRFKELGWTAKGTDGSFLQPFPFKTITNPHANPDDAPIAGTGHNVVAYLDNGAENTVVVGGHYDHLGWGETGGSLHAHEKAIHNGADDNASGIAAMLRMAEILKDRKVGTNNNYLFIAFSGEEMGLFGSKYFVNNPTVPLASINYMLNMDMVGRLNEERVLAVNAVGTSPVWNEVLPIIKRGRLKIKTTDSGIGPSDHTSFYLKDIPVLHFFTGQHRQYHKPEDDVPLINFPGIYDVSEYLLAIIEKLDNKGKVEFTKTKQREERSAAAFKVTLGVMPDYVYSGTGMKIDAVIEGRVAHKAGLKDGDIVIKIGETDVKDIYGYMEGLSKYKAGDKAPVIVKRGKKEVEVEVVF